jgi:hypothetical protein
VDRDSGTDNAIAVGSGDLLGHEIVKFIINQANPNARESSSSALARRSNRRELNSNGLPKSCSSESNCPNLRQPNRQSKIQKRLVA